MAQAAGVKIGPVWLVWAGLVTASGAGFALGDGLGSAGLATALGLFLAAGKIHMIFGHYMEVAWQHRPLRLILQVWLTIATAILLLTYFIK